MSKILVFLEENNGTLKRNSYESITAAVNTGKEIAGVIINGSNAAINSASEYGLSKVYNINHSGFTNYSPTAAAKSISELAIKNNFDTVIFAANSRGKDLAPRVSVRLNAGYVADCVGIDSDFNLSKPVYAGKAQSKITINTSNKVISIRPNVFTATKVGSAGSITIEDFAPTITDADFKEKVVKVMKNEGKIDVAEADKIVSGGRGLKAPEHFSMIEDLAKALGGGVGASRAVVDAGWRPHGEQVGQTGKTVSPNLYVACGISGAVQHLAGMSSSKIIVAINKDKDAPIFKIADYGIVGDVFEVLPKLTEKIKALG